MSFSKTVSSVAALTTIFGASIAAWKVVQYNESQKNPQETQLRQEIVELKKELLENKKRQEELLNTLKTPEPPVVPEKNETPSR